MIRKIKNEWKGAGHGRQGNVYLHHYSSTYAIQKAMVVKALLIAAIPSIIVIAILSRL